MKYPKIKRNSDGIAVLVDSFYHKGLLCAVVKMDRGNLTQKIERKLKYNHSKNGERHLKDALKLSLEEYHNGYVELKESIYNYQDLQEFIKSVELTFSGNLPFFKDIKFVGFDTNHEWNWKCSESRTAKAVRKDVIRLADEISKLDWKKIQPLVMARKL